MNYFVEVRTTTQRTGAIKIVPLSEVHNHRGFRTVFAWDESMAEHVTATGSTRDLRGVPVYCDNVFVDFDGTDATPLLNYLTAEGIAHEIYDSGNRSIHVHISTEPVFGEWVPRSVKAFMKKNAPGSDLSFYHPAGMYRLPGTYHRKTGRPKVLLRVEAGRKLVITEVEEYRSNLTPKATSESLEEFYALLMMKRGSGKRSLHIWILARHAAQLGLSMDEAYQHIQWWNSKFADPPQDDRTIERQIGEGYKHQGWSAHADIVSKMAEG